MKNKSKISNMPQAVARLVRPRSSIVLGAGLEAAIPFAVGHEIIRQQRKDLTLIGPISDALFDMMIGGGVVSRIIAAWVGNVGTGIGYHFRRAVEKGEPNPIEVVNHSNLSVATALDAGAMGLSFGLTRSLFGSDISADENYFRPVTCPFTGVEHLAVKALRPDLAVIHAQRADEMGNTHLWGNLGIVPEAVKASRQVLVTVEEITSTEVIRSDPNRTLVPGFKVAAVVEAPWGAHPSPVQGYYGHDDDFYVDYARRTKDPDDSRAWFEEWVWGVKSREEYIIKFGPSGLDHLRPRKSALAAPVEMGC